MKPVAMISGGTSGVGLAAAQLLVENDYDVAICGRATERLPAARAKIEKLRPGAKVLAMAVDLVDPRQAVDWCEQVHLQFGRIDVLINAAAIAVMTPFEELSEQQFEATLNVNIRSLFRLTQAVWRVMKEQGNGAIINISSMAAVSPFPGFTAYGSSKAWLDLFSKALAVEGKPIGIRVHSLQLGAVETPMLRGLLPDFPAQQTVSPDEVAEVIFGLLDPCWRNSNGQIVQVSRQ